MAHIKGIILAGGSGTRLYPATCAVVKQLLPVYDKPMIYYPLSALMDAGIRDILIISTPEALPGFRDLLGDGSRWGIRLSYAAQPAPGGLAEAFLIGEEFIGPEPVCLILGDNLFYGEDFSGFLTRAIQNQTQAAVFACAVENPQAFGVCEFGADGELLSITEKPDHPSSPHAVSGLYLYPGDAPQMAKSLRPSPRGELEITDLNNAYLRQGRLTLHKLPGDTRWFDMGTPEDLLAASNFVAESQHRGIFIGYPEEIALSHGYITRDQLRVLAESMDPSGYRRHILKLAGEKP